MIAIFLTFPWQVLGATESAGVTASVVKAEFEASTIEVVQKEEFFELSIHLINSGGLGAKPVAVFVLYPDALSYSGAVQDEGTITTQGSSFGQFVEWQLEAVDAKESRELTLTFESPDEIAVSSEKTFSVSIVSPVSIPMIKKVTIGADIDTFSKDPDRFQRFLNATYIRYVSFKRWLTQKFFAGE